MSAQIGYAIGVFFAAGGIGFIFLGFLWLIRVYKRWPTASYMSAAGFAALVGLITASANHEYLLTLIPTLSACGYIVWRGRKKAINLP